MHKKKLAPVIKRIEAIAGYLETKYWHNPDANKLRKTIANTMKGSNKHIEQLFTMEELNREIKNTKNDDEPGPDRIRMEPLKWTTQEHRELLLAILLNLRMDAGIALLR